MFIGLDIGGTKIASIVVDTAGKTIARGRKATDSTQLSASIIQAIYDLLESAAISPSTLLGIGAGVPGMVNSLQGEVSHALNLGIRTPLPLAKILADEFDTCVRIENDVRLAAYGVCDYLGLKNLVYLSLGTGVSAGVVIDGKLYRGQNGMAGEIGHVPVNDQGETLEQLISGTAIVHQARTAGFSVEHAGDLYTLAHHGDEKAVRLVEHISLYIGRAIQWLMMAYDIDIIVLGGGVLQSDNAVLNALFDTFEKLRTESQLLDALNLSPDKIRLLPQGFNAGEWGAIKMVT